MSRFNHSPFARASRLNVLFNGQQQFGHDSLAPAALIATTTHAARGAAPRSPRRPAESADATSDGIHRYGSLAELNNLLKSLEELPGMPATAAHGKPSSAIVVALPPRFAGQAASLIRRRRLGDRLALTASSGELLLPDWSFLDASRSLGWRQILVEPDWRTAVRAAYHAVGAAGRVVVCWPAWIEPSVEAGDLASFIALVAAECRAARR